MSYDSGHRFLTSPNHLKTEFDNINNSPYGDSYYAQSTGFIPPQSPKKPVSKWIKFGIPTVIIIIAAVVVGIAIGVSKNKSSNSSSSASSSSSSLAASDVASANSSSGLFAIATGSLYLNPIYPSTTNTILFTSPTTIPNSPLSFPQDPFQPSNPSLTSLRPDRPRLIAPSYMWDVLPGLISQDPYLTFFNETIFNNASQYYELPPVLYKIDGAGNGALDTARQVKERMKAFSYVYRMTNDSMWSTRVWLELQNAAGNTSAYFGPDVDKWNSVHFLDTAEFTAAFAIAYDWLYDVWTEDQKSQIRWTMIEYGLGPGTTAYENDGTTWNGTAGWWSVNIEGNWNCVCNGGLTLGALAILDDDDTGTAELILSQSINNAKENCLQAVSSDGTWSETANYWYFGTTAIAEMISSLITAAGSDFGLLSANPNLALTALYHIQVTGPTTLFNYGDCGPNKFSTTANAMFLFSNLFNNPRFALFQRDRQDASDPWSMFWYDASVEGGWWNDLDLDMAFTNSTDSWVSMRSSWTDSNALYTAMKVGQLLGHQTHGDLDDGDFVLDALGTRWAGELGSGDYDSTGYFSSEGQDSQRWLYYRKRTEGQNTIMVNASNQNVNSAPTLNFGSTNTSQQSSTVFQVPENSTGFAVADLTSAYFNTNSLVRGIRMINNRRQVLLQDELDVTAPAQWRMHTNATVTIDSSGTSATLSLEGKTLIMQLLNKPSNAVLGTALPVRLSSDPPLPPGEIDQPNDGVTVVTIDVPAGISTLQVLFSPQWADMSASDFITPPNVSLADWSITSHNP